MKMTWKKQMVWLTTIMVFAGGAWAQTLYVSAESGSDTNDGYTWTTAKKSIQSAINVALDGNTIIVGDGLYSPIVCTNKTLTIQSVHGAFFATIDAGGKARRCADLGDDVSLVGFTLQNGKFPFTGYDTDWEGGGGARGGILLNCIVRNNSGRDGGGVQGTECHNCLLYGNNALNGGGGSNTGKPMYNCTIVGNTAKHNGGGIAGGDCYNCIICGNTAGVSDTQNTAEKYWASVFQSCLIGKTVVFVDATNGDYRLADGTVGINAGDNSYVTSEADLAGVPRIINGTVDIGCYEKPISITSAEVSLDQETFKYDGGAHEPVPTVRIGDAELIKDSDFSVTYQANVNAGTARVIVAGCGIYEGRVTNTFTITVRTVMLASEGGLKSYDGEPLISHKVTVSADGFAEGEGADYDWTGTQTDAGSSENVFSYTLHEGTLDENYEIIILFGTLTVEKGTQKIVFPEIGVQVATNTVELRATANSGLEVIYEVDGPAVLEGNLLSFTRSGTVTVIANQAGNENWEKAEPVAQEIIVEKARAVVALGDVAQVYDGEEKSVAVITAPVGLGVVVTYEGTEALPVGAGSYVVLAVVIDDVWEGSAEGVLNIAKGSQSIEFAEIGAQAATNAVVLSAEASTGMEVKFAVLSGPGSVAGNVLTFTGAGTVTVMALQEGDANWAQATVLRSVAVSAVPVEVALSGLEQVYDGAAKAVTVETVPEGVAMRVTYEGSEEAPVGAGRYAVVAESADGRFAGRAEGTLVVAKGSQSIEFGEIGAQVATNVVALRAVASSGLDVSYHVEGPAVLDGGTLAFTGAGTVTVTASQGGDGN